MRSLLAVAVVLVMSFPDRAAAGDAPPPLLGKAIPDFTSINTHGEHWSLHDARDKKAVVVAFMGTECPISNNYVPRLVELNRTYQSRGVQFVVINSNAQDSAQTVAEHAKRYAVSFPVLKDAGSRVADLFAAQRTPEVFVLDAQRRVRYLGRIDDQFGYRYNRPRPAHSDLADALDAVLAGKEVAHPVTAVEGCRIARAGRPDAAGKITYTRDIAPILQRNCQECHRPGQLGPMSLLNYDNAADWSATIREVIEQERMPPWNADPRYGHFSNDRRLSKQERETLLTWIDDGCPRGDDRDLPPARAFSGDWRIGKPDVVFKMPRPFTVPARATNGIRYQHFTVPTNFKEDVWIQAAEAHPGNRAVVHHIIVYVIEPGKMRQRGEDRIGKGFLVGYAPGDMPAQFPVGTGKRIPKGAYLVFQMHYTPNGTTQTDCSSVGLIFAPKPPKYTMRTRSIMNPRFAIPAGDSAYKVVSATTFRQDAMLYSLLPHMHLRGKSFSYRAIFPDGKEQMLLSVPRWDFNWQSNYRLAQPLKLPAGTRIECTAFYDNSINNPNNPDPSKIVRWGDQTWEEMMIGFADYTYVN
ncbi:MAG TPA: redoxin family protein [Gemmataceae bacterium]|nr:redoxin family protein [Gemmataceae bacterium]